MFGQGPLAERFFFDELWELWVTMKWQIPGDGPGSISIQNVQSRTSWTYWPEGQGKFWIKHLCPAVTTSN